MMRKNVLFCVCFDAFGLGICPFVFAHTTQWRSKFFWSWIWRLKPNACNNKARRIKFHRYVCQFLPRDHGGFGHKNQKMSDFLGIAQKVRHFLILVPKTAIVSWQKLSNISMELAAPNMVLLLTLLYLDMILSKDKLLVLSKTYFDIKATLNLM